MRWRQLFGTAAFIGLGLLATEVFGQSFGVELHNTIMPASGGMAGVSLARPQDVTSAINANPATLTQFSGTEFTFGGFWGEPTYRVQHDGGVLPSIGAFSEKSDAQGSAGGNLGVAQELDAFGLPVTLGIGLFTAAGAGVDLREFAASNGTSSSVFVLEMTNAVGVELTEQLSAGASLSLGTGFFDGPFVGLSAMVYDYALRGTVGLNYDLHPGTTFGVSWQTKQNFTFDNAITLELPVGGFDPITRDIAMDLPENLGFGVANSSLMDGNLLLGVDVLFKQWDNADLFRSIYENQWVVQAGAQYSAGRIRYRVGYAFAENPMQSIPDTSAGGIAPPGAVAAIQYLQAQLAVISRHRFSAGVGITDLLPGVDFDLSAGGMFEESQDFGAFSSASIESYWISAGLTWHFGGPCVVGESCE